MAGFVDGADAEVDVVLGDGDVDGDGLAWRPGGHVADELPVEGDGVAPEELVVVHSAGSGIPAEEGVAFSLVCIKGDFGGLAGELARVASVAALSRATFAV